MSRIEGSHKQIPNPSIYMATQERMAVKKTQRKDKEIQKAIVQLQKQDKIKTGHYKRLNMSIKEDILYKGNRIVISPELTKFIIWEYHDQCHLGIENTKLAICARFYWLGMNAQIEEFVKKCRTCSQCKHAPRPKAAVQNHKDTQNIFEMAAIDIASMSTSIRGNGYFLLIVDNYSKLMTTIAMQDAKAEIITDKLWRNWFCYFGIPKFLQSDQGSNVHGEKVRKLCADLAIKKVRSSSYHSQGNGSAERAIGFLKTILRSVCLSRSLNISHWDDVLPEAILHCNNTTNASTKFSPFQVAYGTPADMPLDNKLDIPQLAALDPGLIRENVGPTGKRLGEITKSMPISQ